MRTSFPDVHELREIRLREELTPRILDVEFPTLRHCQPCASVRILASGSFIEPFRLPERTVGRRSEHSARESLDADMKGVIGEEIRRVHPILTVCVLGNLRNQPARLFVIDDGELHLDERPRHVDLGAPRRMDGRRRLPTVHDLEILHPSQQQPALVVINVDCFGGGGDAVVVGEEHRGARSRGSPGSPC